MKILEGEQKRQKEVYENITITHMFCLFALMFALALREDIFSRNNHYVINMQGLLFLSFVLIGFAAITLYNSKYSGTLPPTSHFSWVDFIYSSFPLLVAGLTIFIVEDRLYYPQAILLLPVIIMASTGGKKPGLVMAAFTTGVLLTYSHIIVYPGSSVFSVIEANLIFISVIFIIGWFVGVQTDLERQYRQQLTRLANTDMLTGLYNHRYFQEKLQEYFEKATETNPLSLIFIDIDDFKYYNDSFGHVAGDYILSTMGAILEKRIKNGFVARYGGDEFVIVLPNHSANQAFEVAQDLRNQVKNRKFPYEEHQPQGKIAISCGIATAPSQARSQKELIKYADEALFKAKSLDESKIELYSSMFENLKIEKGEEELINSLKTLVSIINAKDRYTYGHSERVTDYAVKLARKIRLPEDQIGVLRYAAFLHDIGKIEIDREILNKESNLNAEEWNILKQHPRWGSEIIMSVKNLQPAAEVVLNHHENYDGSGYPAGLKGNDIPLLARIIRLADSYDAMISNRPYKRRCTQEDALMDIEKGKGITFDPDLIQPFIEVVRENCYVNPMSLPMVRQIGIMDKMDAKGYG